MASECVDGSFRASSCACSPACSPESPCCSLGHSLHIDQRLRNICSVCSAHGTEYRCSPCDFDLCVQCYHKAKAKILLGPCCNELHRLVACPRRRTLCDACGCRRTQYRCPEGCDYNMCSFCYIEAKAKVCTKADFQDDLSECGESRSEQTSTVATSHNPEQLDECNSSSDHASTVGSVATLECSALPTGPRSAFSDSDSKTGFARLWKNVWHEEELRTAQSDSSAGEEDQSELMWTPIDPRRAAPPGFGASVRDRWFQVI